MVGRKQSSLWRLLLLTAHLTPSFQAQGKLSKMEANVNISMVKVVDEDYDHFFPDGSLRFSSAALPESLQSLNIENNGASGENYQNFYTKTKDIEVDEDLIKQLQLAQQAIDDGLDEEGYSEEEYEDNHDIRSLRDDYTSAEGNGVYSSLTDFGIAKTEQAGEDVERFDCFSCDSPDCSFGGVSGGCIQCFTAHIRCSAHTN